MTHQDMMARNLRQGIEAIRTQRIKNVFDNTVTLHLWMSVMIRERTGNNTAAGTREVSSEHRRREYIHGMKTAALLRKLKLRKAA